MVFSYIFYNDGIALNHWTPVKFIIDNIWLIALILISGGALLWPHLQRRGEKVSSLQATQLINQGKTIIVDVRDPAAFAAGHVRDAKNIPLKELPKRIGELEKFKSKAVVVVCQSGVQSSKGTTQLKSAGFNEVYSLNGGLAAWQAQGLPTAK
jgi:rhodanese-related sulfurtransferase